VSSATLLPQPLLIGIGNLPDANHPLVADLSFIKAPQIELENFDYPFERQMFATYRL